MTLENPPTGGFLSGNHQELWLGEAIPVGSSCRLFKNILRRQVRVGVFYLTQACPYDLRVAPEKVCAGTPRRRLLLRRLA